MTALPEAQRQPQLNRIHQLLDSDVFDKNRPNDGNCELAFVEVLQLLDKLLQQAAHQGHRIDFINEVGTHGKIQDITSLISDMGGKLIAEPGKPTHFADRQFNCYHDAGTGYFANGYFFSADYASEVAFFVDEQRIYLNRHIKRALREIEAQ